MAVFLIGYDFKDKSEETYEELFAAIRKLHKEAWHDLDSTWMISSESSAKEIRDSLSSHFSDGDKLLVVKIGGEAPRWSTLKLDSAASWFKKYL